MEVGGDLTFITDWHRTGKCGEGSSTLGAATGERYRHHRHDDGPLNNNNLFNSMKIHVTTSFQHIPGSGRLRGGIKGGGGTKERFYTTDALLT